MARSDWLVLLLALLLVLSLLQRGWLLLTNKDAAWERHARRLRARGLEPQRGASWERTATYAGIVCLLAAPLLLALVLRGLADF